MTNTVNVTVKEIKSAKRNTRFGEKDVYTVVGNNGEHYELGFKKPAVKVGDSVKIAYEDNSYGHQVTDIMKESSGASSEVSTPPATAPRGKEYTRSEGRMFPVPELHGDRSIIRQNALAHAARLVSQSDLIARLETLGESDDHKYADRMANIVIHMAKKFEAYSSGYDLVEAVEKRMAAEEGASK